MIYLDATFFLRLYIDESGFEVIRNLVAQEDRITTSILGKMETESALHRQLREGRISAQVFRQANRQFAQDRADLLVTWLPLSPAIAARVEQTFLDLPANVFLRTGDAVHLATAAEAGFKEIYSNDRHLLAAAPLFKLKGINPLSKKSP